MKKLLKFASLFLTTCILCFSNSTFSYANSLNSHSHSILENCSNENCSEEERAIITCPNSPSKWHIAYSKGTGELYRGSQTGYNTQIFNNGRAWQCKYCYEVIVTQGHPGPGNTIGYYGTENPRYPVAERVKVFTNEIMYTSGNQVEGFTLRYP